jgi:hypothetical protein
MNIKILVGSVGTVAILILVSFTSVVSVQSITPGRVNDSPLFEYRTTRAIKKTPDTMQCRYIGMGRTFFAPFSTPDNREQIVMKFIDCIVRMDDHTFDVLIMYCINHLTKDGKGKTINIAAMVSGLRNLRSNPESLIDQITNKMNTGAAKYEIRPQQYTLYGDWIPGCLLAAIFYMLFIYPIIVTFILISAWKDCFYSFGTGCDMCPCYRVQINKYFSGLDGSS